MHWNGATHSLSRYWADWDAPRPESYREDVQLAEGLSTEQARRLWHHLATAAESGWDFSSRWMSDPPRLASTRCSEVRMADVFLLLGPSATKRLGA